ncbi:MAG: ParB/RepB/Spo0J family partition protein [Planctomycetaceae bacterium]|nr:MAG: ParB/RepB/Spo0J family partition protein [Planctomycetaceae bacterium]
MTEPVKPRLGRGLSSLISNFVQPYPQESAPATQSPEAAGQAAAGTSQTSTAEISIDKITPNPYQPRREFNPDDLRDLAASITSQGILQPLIVAPHTDVPAGDAYVLIAGERRLRAAKLAGLAVVPCVVRQATRQQMLEWALIENIQRADLNPVERAVAYRDYMDRFQLTVALAAEKLGQPRTTVSNYLRILELCDEIQTMLVSGVLSFGHAKVLASLAGDVDRQVALARRVMAETLSVRQLEQVVETITIGHAAVEPPKPPKVKAAYLVDLEDQLTRTVGTKVCIQPGRAKNTGRIVIEYYSLDDFDRLCGTMGLTVEG